MADSREISGHTITLPKDHWLAVDKIASDFGIDRSAVIERAVRVYQLAIWQAETTKDQS